LCPQLFAKLREELPKFRHQIVAISGDCSLPGLGISSSDRETLIREVSIVFHVAATVRFDEKLKLAVAINVQSPRDVLTLCKEMPQLKVSILKIPNALSSY
jgi:fatty acyl-CoA reductase